jgi:ligand-binding sensor domain-containing protein/serine phosphatase RsbU (regulator of sigma subunit)
MRIFIKAFFTAALLLIPRVGFSQDYKISHYGWNEGITHQFVYTINQDKNGFIWLGTGQGLCRFNGFVFDPGVAQDSLANEVASVSYRDNAGDLWFGYQSGHIARYDGHTFKVLHPGVELTSAITAFANVTDDQLLFTTLNKGVFVLDKKSGKSEYLKGCEPGIYTSMCLNGNNLILGTSDGLKVYALGTEKTTVQLLFAVSELDFTRVQDILLSRSPNTYWVATEDKGLFRLYLSGTRYDLSRPTLNRQLNSENIQTVLEDAEGLLWLSTLHNGIFMLDPGKKDGEYTLIKVYNKQNGLTENAIKRVFEDIEGNKWVATYGGGISLFTQKAFSILSADIPGLDNNIQAVVSDEEGNIYLGGTGGLFCMCRNREGHPVRVGGIPAESVTALLLDGKKLFVGTESQGLIMFDITTKAVRKIAFPASSMGKQVSSIASDNQHIYLGTRDGIYIFSKDYNKIVHLTTADGLPHNSIEQIIVDSKGRVLFATRAKGVYQLTDAGEARLLYKASNSEIKFRALAEDTGGDLWAATDGDGLVYFDNDSVYQYTVASGLKANFCYSIAFGPDHSIWVGHRLGLSRINTQNLKVSKYDKNIDVQGDCNPNAIFADKKGKLYIGTTKGIILYDMARENKRKRAPFTNIVSVLISDKQYDFSNEIVLPYRPYKLRIDFVGLNFSDPQSVRYQYKLEGNDLEWSEMSSQSFAFYPRIEDGEYVFYVRSFDNEGLNEINRIPVHIRIKAPFWKTWWFLLLSIAALVILVWTIIKVRERRQKQLQEYLERELALRTKEVVEQKEEIEIKNRDITDSINYAKRIQTSMLPPIKRLQQYFSGSFVFYYPRDIVSGDFYWFDKVNNNKFTIVCADSTGHGVPGAFMSMIGSTLIKDICNREAGNSPSQVLQVLDCELRNTLNQNMDDGSKPGDGMDIIVCEIDLLTHYVRYASAMRPMIIYRNGEEVFVKGSRNSVGGHYERDENLFEDEGLQLTKGDTIYMFSDGYSDQFGGPMGKKFKMVRLKNLLHDIHQKPMEEQYNHVKNTFHLWKENYEQVDDVLFMGIRI